MNHSRIKILQMGLGPIGQESVKLLSTKAWAQVVGGVDIDPAKVGQSLSDLCGMPHLGEAVIVGNLSEALDRWQPDVILHTAGSRAKTTFDQVRPALERGLAVVSSCEELLFPGLREPTETAEIDELCRRTGGRILGTGVNPGFVMDVLPVCLTGVCVEVRSVYGERVVDAGTRRLPLQQKVGSGMDPDAFRELFKQKKAGHAGFQESLALIAHALGWQIGPIEETCEPIVAEKPLKSGAYEIETGQTRGLHQRVVARTQDDKQIELDLKMYQGAEDPHDAVRITGVPSLEMRLPGGVAGDQATIAALANALPRVLRAEPGVRLMTDIAVPCHA